MAKPESPTDKHISRVPADLESQGIEEVGKVSNFVMIAENDM